MSNLTSYDMADLQCQGIAIEDNNNPSPENIPSLEDTPLPQFVDFIG